MSGTQSHRNTYGLTRGDLIPESTRPPAYSVSNGMIANPKFPERLMRQVKFVRRQHEMARMGNSSGALYAYSQKFYMGRIRGACVNLNF